MSSENPVLPIVRGHEQITKDDVRGHLALALRLENIGVFLGAGSSIGVGGVSMSELWANLIPESTKDWLRGNGFASADIASPNVETILSKMDIALADALRRQDSATDLRSHRAVVCSAVVSAAVLSEDLWNDRSSPAASAQLRQFNLLLARLQASRQPGQAAPWCFSLNYDLAVDWAAESLGIHVVNGFAGLHDRQFQPSAFDLSLQNTRATGEARFGSYNLNLVKLHGSLTWRIDSSGSPVEVPCSSAWGVIDRIINGQRVDTAPLLILPTSAKYVEAIGFVYGELIRRFTEFLARSNSALIVSGYSFRDDHINRLLASGLLNPTLQLIIYFPEWKDITKPIPNGFLERIHALGLPRVIIHGGAEMAYFSQMTEDLPDPAMIDELSDDVKRVLRKLASIEQSAPSQQ